MNTVSNNIFSVNVPDEMVVTNPLGFKTVLYYPNTLGSIDKPQIVISLNEIENYEDYDGTDLLSKFRTSAIESRFKAEESGFDTQTKNGLPIYIVHAFTKTVFQKVEYDFIYFDALIVINELFCLEFLVTFERVDAKDFTPIYTSILDSLQWSENTEDWGKYFEEMNRRIAEIENKYAATTNEITQEWDIPIADFQIPSDGKDVFDIGGFGFDIIQNQSSIDTASHSKELLISIVAQTKKYKEGEKKLLLSINDYSEASEKGLVKISFPMTEIYNNGIPKGSVKFVEDKCETPYSTISKEGFEYTLDFFGQVTLENGWLGINGYLKPPYHEKPIFDVKIYKQFDYKNINWRNYSFKSLEEALQAPRDVVEYLDIKNPVFDVLPDAIFEFKNLKSLWIADTTWGSKLNLHFISDRIGELKHLEILHIFNAQIKEIPACIGDLKKLTHVSFSGNQIKRIPDSVMQLPALLYLNFDNNLIEEIPAFIDLPSLYSIDLKGNLLKTLPENLVFQPKINAIHLEKNPLEFLPKAYNDFQKLELSIDDKRRLLDYEYKGAGNSGTVSWNDAIYYCAEKDNLTADFEAIIEKNKLQKYRDALLSLTKKTIGFSHATNEDYAQVGNHRFGGHPDLPLDIPYPTFIHNYEGETEYKYEFIGQINCESIAELQDYLPRNGTLFFFLETLHNLYGGANNPCKVIYVKENNTLSTGNRFAFDEADYYEMFELYSSFKVNAVSQLSVPAFYSIQTNAYLFNKNTGILQDIDDYHDALYDKFEEPIHDKYPHDYAINAYGFTQHESPELQASLKLKGNPEDWTILLKVTSSGDMQWGDAGDLFFVIHKSDLAKSDFSNVFVTMESS